MGIERKERVRKKEDTLVYLDGFGSLQGLFRWNASLPLSQQLLDEVGDVSPGNGDVFDAAAYHIALRLCEHTHGWKAKNDDGH